MIRVSDRACSRLTKNENSRLPRAAVARVCEIMIRRTTIRDACTRCPMKYVRSVRQRWRNMRLSRSGNMDRGKEWKNEKARFRENWQNRRSASRTGHRKHQFFRIFRIINDTKKETSTKLRAMREERLRRIGISVSSFVIVLGNHSDLFYIVVEKRKKNERKTTSSRTSVS